MVGYAVRTLPPQGTHSVPYSIAIVLCLTLFVAAPAASGEVITQGLAPMDNQSLGSARLQAIQEAERRAGESSGMRIMGSDQTGGLSTLQVQGEGRLGETRVVEESAGDGMLQVKTAVNVDPAGSCAAANQRKKLAVVNFTMAHPDQSLDIYEPGRGLAMDLLRALESTRHYLMRNAVTVDVFPDPNLAPALDAYGDPRTIVALGRKIDAQFIVAGSILDLTTADSVYTRGANGVTSLFGFQLEPFKRDIRVGLYLFDSLTGNELMAETYDESVVGDVYFANGTPFNSREFQQSALGEAVKKIIARQTADIAAKVDCLPLMERIVKVEKPYVYINAGASSNMQVGDTLAVYHQLGKPLPGVYYQNERLLGYAEELKTTMTITQVQPSFSIGRLEMESAAVHPMDFVRSW